MLIQFYAIELPLTFKFPSVMIGLYDTRMAVVANEGVNRDEVSVREKFTPFGYYRFIIRQVTMNRYSLVVQAAATRYISMNSDIANKCLSTPGD